MHICVSKLTIIGSDNGLSPERRQAIIWTNAGILLIGPLGTNFSEILIVIQTFSLKKIRLKLSSAKCCSFRLGLNDLSTAVSIVGPLPVQHQPQYWQIPNWGFGPAWGFSPEFHEPKGITNALYTTWCSKANEYAGSFYSTWDINVALRLIS